MRKIFTAAAALAVALGAATSARAAGKSAKSAKGAEGWGVRAGLGTDIGGGLAYGLGANYLLKTKTPHPIELGVVLFGGSFDESSTEGVHTYNETTDVFVFGALANYLVNYSRNEARTFFVAGFGLASISVDWQESSPTDTSLGTLLPGGGSTQSADASSAGTVFNLGIGRTFGQGADLRFEIPVIMTFDAPGKASSVIPTFILTGGYRF